MIEGQITPRTRAIIINTPNNPSGAVLNPADFQAILRLAHKRGIYVICRRMLRLPEFYAAAFFGWFRYGREASTWSSSAHFQRPMP